MTADLDTRCGELYASGGGVLPDGQIGSDAAAEAATGGGSPGDSAGVAGFASSREQFESLVWNSPDFAES